jgi:hypothetical protein
VQDILRGDDEELLMIACVVIANVEQYSYARQWCVVVAVV